MTRAAPQAAGARVAERRRSAGWLLALWLLALGLRLAGIGWHLPQRAEPDAVLVRQAIWYDQRWHGDPAVIADFNTQYPPLIGFALAALPGRLVNASSSPELADHLATAAWPWWLGRVLVAVLASLIVPLGYHFARGWCGRRASLLCAALLATSLLHTHFSTQARPHGVLASALLFGLLAAQRRARKGTWSSAAGMGVGAGLALACLQNGAALGPACLAAEMLVWRRFGWRRCLHALLALALVALAAWWAYPTLFGRADPMRFEVREDPNNLNLTGHVLLWRDFDGAGFGLCLRYLWGYDPLLLVLAAAGGAWSLARALRGAWSQLGRDSRTRAWVALSFALPYALVLGSYQRTFSRFLLPLLPCAALLGAALVEAVLARRARPAGARAWALASALVLALPLADALRLAQLRLRPDTRELAADWLAREHAEAAPGVAVHPGLALPALASASALETLPEWMCGPWTLYLRSWRALRCAGPTLRLVPLWNPRAQGGVREQMRPERLEPLLRGAHCEYVLIEVGVEAGAGRDALSTYVAEHCGAPVASFEASRFGTLGEDPDGYSLDDGALARIWRAERFGPTLALHRL